MSQSKLNRKAPKWGKKSNLKIAVIPPTFSEKKRIVKLQGKTNVIPWKETNLAQSRWKKVA